MNVVGILYIVPLHVLQGTNGNAVPRQKTDVRTPTFVALMTHQLRFFFFGYSRTLGCSDPVVWRGGGGGVGGGGAGGGVLGGRVGAPISVLLGLVASYLIYANARLHIPMTHRNNRTQTDSSLTRSTQITSLPAEPNL